MQILAAYRKPSHLRSMLEIAITFGAFVGLWALAWTAYYFGWWWLSLLLAVPAAGFLVRLFMIQHDCGHGAFFRQRLVLLRHKGSAACASCDWSGAAWAS